MSRNIRTDAIEYLASAKSIRIAHLVELELPNSTKENPAFDYLTDYSTEVSWGGKVYSPDRVTSVGDVRQGKGLTNYKLKVDIAGEYDEELQRAINDNGQTSYTNKGIRVYRAYLDEDGSIIPFDINTNGPMEYFFGLITDVKVDDGIISGEAKVTWQCSGKFQDFEMINGRITDDTSHRGLVTTATGESIPSDSAKKEAYKTDTGFQHANQTINLISKYTTTEKRYKMKSSFFGLKSKLKEYEVEVEKELELGVDLAAQYLPAVRGVRRVPGIPVFMDTLKDNPSKLYVVYALCEGPASLLNVYVDGESAICLDQTQEDTDMCLGSQRNGDTLAKYVRASGGYVGLHSSYSPKASAAALLAMDARLGSEVPDRSTMGPIFATDDSVSADKGLYNNTTFTITNSTGVKQFYYHPGTQDQEANTTLVNLAASNRFFRQNIEGVGPSYWDSNSRLLDTAYIVLVMTVSEEEQEIPEIEAVVEAHPRNTSGDELVSLNPADHLLQYLTSTAYGGDTDINDLNLPSFDYVRNYYDTELTSYDRSWATPWRYLGWKDNTDHVPKLLECNSLIKTEETVTKNIEGLLAQMDATLNQLGGKYHLSIEDNSATIADITTDEVKGAVKIEDATNKNKWNSINANIIDPAYSWSANKIVFFDSGYLEQDKKVTKKGNVTFQHITNYYVARNWAKRQLDKSRFSRKISFTTYYKYIYLYPNANVTFTYPRMGWDKKKFRVAQVNMKANGLVDLVLEETSDVIYDDIEDTQVSIPPASSGKVSRPTGLEIVPPDSSNYNFPDAENIYGFLLWDPYEGDGLLRYEVQDWNRPDAPDITISVPYNRTIQSVGGDTKVYHPITDIEAGEEYTFKVRVLDRYGSYSKYSIINKTFAANDKPTSYSDVTGFTASNTDANGNYVGGTVEFSWDLHPSPEITAYQIKFLDKDTLAGIGIATIQATEQVECVYTFDISENMSMYANNNSGAVGAYRDYLVQIRANASNGSSDWVYLN